MFEKYIKLIQNSKNKKQIVESYLQNIGISEFYLDIIGQEVYIKVNSLDLFLLESKKEELEDFLKENEFKLVLK